jgi:hypothetical protein
VRSTGDSEIGLKLFGFIPEPVFAFIPESVRDHPGMPLGFTPESRSSGPDSPRAFSAIATVRAALATTPQTAAWNRSVAAVWEQD